MSDVAATSAQMPAAQVAALSEYLAAHVEGFAGPLAVSRCRGGQSNPTWLLDTPARRYVLRSKPAPRAQLLPSAHAIEREYRVQSALAGSGLPLAPMLCLCGDESVIGRAFYVMGHVEGRIFWDPTLPELAPAQRAAVYDELNRVIALLHGIDPGAHGLDDFGRHERYVERQVARWTGQYRASETVAIAAMDRLIDWLPAHIPPDEPGRSAIVHGDYRLDNVIFDPADARIIAVIDWELSTLGDARADFAYHLLTWHLPGGVFRGLADIDIGALGVPAATDYIARYEQRSGRSVGDAWPFYLAYNLFRLAAILQGVVKRAQDGIASSPQASAYASQIAPMAELGWRFARQAGAPA